MFTFKITELYIAACVLISQYIVVGVCGTVILSQGINFCFFKYTTILMHQKQSGKIYSISAITIDIFLYRVPQPLMVSLCVAKVSSVKVCIC